MGAAAALSFFSAIVWEDIFERRWEDLSLFSRALVIPIPLFFGPRIKAFRSRLSPSVYRVKEIIIIRYRRPIPLYCTPR